MSFYVLSVAFLPDFSPPHRYVILILFLFQMDDSEYEAIEAYVSEPSRYVDWVSTKNDKNKLRCKASHYKLIDNRLCFKATQMPVISKSKLNVEFEKIHRAHQGYKKVYADISARYAAIGLQQAIQTLVKECDRCWSRRRVMTTMSNFCPPNDELGKVLCSRANIQFVRYPTFITADVVGTNVKTQRIFSSGDCLFKSFAFYISGSTKEHKAIRSSIVFCMQQNPLKGMLEQWFQLQDVTQYVVRSEMEKTGTWGTSVEILAAASMLGIDVYILLPQESNESCRKWSVFPTDVKGQTTTTYAVYLSNDPDHYEPVLSMN